MRRMLASCLVFCLAAAWTASIFAADAPKPEGGPASRQFEEVFGQWKQLLGQLRQLKTEYPDASTDRQAQIEKSYRELLAQGAELEPRLIEAAEKAFVESPGADQELVDFLVSVLRRAVARDDFEAANTVGQLLLQKGVKNDALPAMAGAAAFAVGHWDEAERLLREATKQGTIDELGSNFLSQIPECRRAWTAEEKLRAAEAKADDLPRVLLKTNKGDIELELFENQAPNAVANFISLVEKGFYNGVVFHRVLEHFMAQGGDPTGTGSGGPGYHIACECDQPDARMHFRGSLSMAHAGRDTGGSQFFLTFLPTTHLNGRHTCFGRVVKGLEVLAELQRRDPNAPNPPQPDRIIEAKVLRKRPHEYAPKTMREK